MIKQILVYVMSILILQFINSHLSYYRVTNEEMVAIKQELKDLRLQVESLKNNQK